MGVRVFERICQYGGRLARLLLPGSHLTRWLFAGMLWRIATLPSPAG
jgi:hypothetical protein